jgi:hypothetical protein
VPENASRRNTSLPLRHGIGHPTPRGARGKENANGAVGTRPANGARPLQHTGTKPLGLNDEATRWNSPALRTHNLAMRPGVNSGEKPETRCTRRALENRAKDDAAGWPPPHLTPR